MIKSFSDEIAESIFQRESAKRFPRKFQKIALRKLIVLDASIRLDDLKALPGNRLEKLIGDRAGQYSIRINKQWRICFQWSDGDAYEVEIVDYH